MRGHTPRLRLKSEEDMVQGRDDLSEIPCLVTGLPACAATRMKNSAYNGGVQDSFWIIPWEVCELHKGRRCNMFRKAWQHWNTPLGELYPDNENKKMFHAGLALGTGVSVGLILAALTIRYAVIPTMKMLEVWPW